MLTTNQKGAVAEMAITHEAIKLGIGVLKPLTDMRYDLVFDTGDRLLRVQCKWVRKYGDVLVARLYSNRRARGGMRRSYYGHDEIDAFALYCAELTRCYFVEIADVEGRYHLHLRLNETRNNQRSGVNWARDYEFGAKLILALGP